MQTVMKNYVLFGSGTVAEQNLWRNPAFIVDNNPDLHGQHFHGIPIREPSILNGNSALYQVVVCTTSVSEVRRQLTGYGYTWNEHAGAAESLADKAAIADLEDSRFRFLVSSGLPSTAESFSNGGIYQVEEKDDGIDIQHVYEGNTHGLVKTADGFAFTCQGRGVILLDQQLAQVGEIPLPKGMRPHGLKNQGELWVLVCSAKDCILGVNARGEELFRYSFTDKLSQMESAQHHCNDIEIIGNYAYVSMFSVTGNWKRGIFDGGIIEVDLANGSMKAVTNTLTMPHSITYQPEGFYILDSFKGRLLGPNFSAIAQLPGFARGFDCSREYFFIGESKNRNFSRLETARTPVSLDSRITVISRKHGFSRSIQLPRRISEIHSVINI